MVLVVKFAGTVAVAYNWILLLAVILLVPLITHSPVVVLLILQVAVVTVMFSVTGAVTLTCCVHVADKPALSVAVQVTGVVPNGNVAGALLVNEGVPKLSVAVGLVSA